MNFEDYYDIKRVYIISEKEKEEIRNKSEKVLFNVFEDCYVVVFKKDKEKDKKHVYLIPRKIFEKTYNIYSN